MGSVYSEQLWNVYGTGATFVAGPFVPAGFVWVVRDIRLEAPGSEYSPLRFAHLYTAEVGNIFTIPGGRAHGFRSYEWQGRKILTPGDQLFFAALDLSWDVLVCGYQLSLP